MKVLRACKCPPFDQLRYPLLASPKLDGIRAVMVGGVAVSRNGIPIPNHHVQCCLSSLPDGLDGELVLADWTAPHREVNSAVMSHDGEPDFCYVVFDWISDPPYEERLVTVGLLVIKSLHAPVAVVPTNDVASAAELRDVVARHVRDGFEGTMLRDPKGKYKHGKSTKREGIMMKVKSFDDEEATVLSAYEAEENLNADLASGRRGSSRAGKVAKGHLGGIWCRFDDGTEFGCGSGFTLPEREQYWPDGLVGKRVTIKYQPPPGSRQPGEAPRFPVFKGIRHD
jgi:DNA ligase-1